jgi:type VI secretion system protein ImpD
MMPLNKIKQIIFQCYIFCNEAIEQMTNEILHQEAFQRLEASFIGLNDLIQVADHYADSIIKIKVLNISLHSLGKYILTADAIEETWLFEELYHQEYNHPGGEPYGLLISDYFMDIDQAKHIRCLEKLADMAALAFAPLISAVKHYDEGTALIKNFLWSKLRKRASACFMGLFYPQVLMRRPYDFEKIKSIDDYLWGNPCYDYAIKAISVFNKTGWFSKICAASLSLYSTSSRYDQFCIDSHEPLNRKGLVKFHFSRKKIELLNDAGLTIVSESNWKKHIIFLHNPSIQDKTIKNYTESFSSLLCVVRFIHCLKIMFRNKVGCFTEMAHYENYLQRWLLSYCSRHLPLSSNSRAKYPLAYAKITLNKDENNLTHYPFVVELRPYAYQSANDNICIKSIFIMRK